MKNTWYFIEKYKDRIPNVGWMIQRMNFFQREYYGNHKRMPISDAINFLKEIASAQVTTWKNDADTTVIAVGGEPVCQIVDKEAKQKVAEIKEKLAFFHKEAKKLQKISGSEG